MVLAFYGLLKQRNQYNLVERGFVDRIVVIAFAVACFEDCCSDCYPNYCGFSSLLLKLFLLYRFCFIVTVNKDLIFIFHHTSAILRKPYLKADRIFCSATTRPPIMRRLQSKSLFLSNKVIEEFH